jgi:hypothetical protein
MLEYTGAGDGARLMMLVLHDDAKREYDYGPAQGLPDTKVGAFTQALYDEAKMAHEDFVKRLKAAPYKPFTFKIAGAGIYQLGNFGTAAKRLWSWTPAPDAHK